MAAGVSASTALTLAGFGVSVVFIVFVCARLAHALLRRRRRARSRRARALPRFAFSGYPAAGHPAGGGLDPAAIAAFPAGSFAAAAGARGSIVSDDDTQCVVCLAEYEEQDVLRFLPYCGHNFHMACIDAWLQQNATCPVCRISLRDNLDSSHAVPPPLPASVEISPPCSPQPSRSDPCNCLFVSTGHSSRTLEVNGHEADQENQVVAGQSVGGANGLPLSEANPLFLQITAKQ